MNGQYDQFQSLVDSDGISWELDVIEAYLGTGGSFTSTDTSLSDTGLAVYKKQLVRGREVLGDIYFVGLDLVFESIPAGDYNLVLARNRGFGEPDVLGWFDTNRGDGTLTMAQRGSLIIRPIEAEAGIGVWLKSQDVP